MNFFQTPLGITVITIASGLIGGLFSHLLQRNLQHRAWLFENRITTFADFLKTLEQCRAKVSEYFDNPENPRTIVVVSGKELIKEAWKIYEPAIAHLAVVRLLLKKRHRENFEVIVNDHCCWQCLYKPTNDDEVRHTLVTLRAQMQRVLESHLKYKSFRRRIKRII